MTKKQRSSWSSERGQALIETAFVLPIVLMLSVAIFEFGRAYQTWQILTNAAREGARVAVLPGSSSSDVQTRVMDYMQAGQLPAAASASIAIDQNVTMSIGAKTAKASLVTVNYPFSFVMLNPIANLLVYGSTMGGAPLTMSSSAQMRNEAE